MNRKRKLLKNVLIINATFSELTGLIRLLFYKQSEAIYDLTDGHGLTFGVLLLIFGGFVFYNAFREPVSKSMIYTIIGLDILYVLGAVLRIFSDPGFSTGGLALTGFTALMVGGFAFFQYKGLAVTVVSEN